MALTLNDAPTERLTAAELAAWREIPTAVISDDLNRTSTMQAAIKPVGPGGSRGHLDPKGVSVEWRQ